ncbi:MAG: putative glutamate-semialdehyde aminotransferase, partial [Phycisphaerales bacterium]|nr:putative glutamate-semialdehyde aminotransferase [Phycisphaerales bacterium]
MTLINDLISPLGLPERAVTKRSAEWFDRAKRVLAGGISSSARATVTGNWPYPLYVSRGSGSRVWDVDDNE